MANPTKKAAAKKLRRTPGRAKTRKPQTAVAPKFKIDAVIAALRAPKGATLTQLMALTSWQAHSVRGAMSGAIKKQRGLSISSTKTGAERVYKIGATQ